MPIAAGNLFLGSFEVKPTDILRSTKFGTPFSNIPTSITGYYKYKAGKSFQIDGKPVDNKKISVIFMPYFMKQMKNCLHLTELTYWQKIILISYQ